MVLPVARGDVASSGARPTSVGPAQNVPKIRPAGKTSAIPGADRFLFCRGNPFTPMAVAWENASLARAVAVDDPVRAARVPARPFGAFVRKTLIS
jgi:hypothetical protein